jgi:hypothetical protein
MKVYE